VLTHIERNRGSQAIDAPEALSNVPLRHMRTESFGMSESERSVGRLLSMSSRA
jgi:hypothetical protein